MAQYSLLVDLDRCVGCRACELACKQENQLPEGTQWIRMIKIGPEVVNGTLAMRFVPLPCMHCGKAPCIDVCPTRAISKRPDGIVVIDEAKCIGCRYCLWVCPFGAPQFNVSKGVMEKCKLCLQRVEKGLKPACVRTCHLKALKFGTTEELSELARKKMAKMMLYVPSLPALR